MSFYTDIQTTANNTLAELGQAVTLTSKTTGAYNPATGNAAVTVSTQQVKCVVFPFSARDIDGTLIRQGDQKLLLGMAGTTAPQVDDTVTIGGTTYTIILVKLVAYTSVSVMC